MAEPEPVMCPECGWTGHQSSLDGTACPICDEDIEFVE